MTAEDVRRTQRILNQAELAAATFSQAREDFYAAIRQAERAGATRTQISEAVGLSRTRVQQIIHGTNR